MGTKLFLKNSSNQFLKNSSGSFLYKTLPPEYQEVEYIASDGIPYLSTVSAANKLFVLDLQFTSNSTRQLMGISGSSSAYWGNNCGTWEKVGTGSVSKATTDRVTIYYDVGNITAQRTNTWLEGASTKYAGSDNNWAAASTSPFRVFNLAGATYYGCAMKLYSLKVFSASDEILNVFVPCVRNSDGKPGLYDLVNSNFYTNAGTGEFTIGPCKDLPSTYQWVEYIQSSGSQHINTGYTPNVESAFLGRFVHTEHTIDTPLYGVRTSNYGNSYTFWAHPAEYTASGKNMMIFNNYQYQFPAGYSEGTNEVFYCSKNIMQCNDQIHKYTVSSGSPNLPLILLGLSNGGTIDGRKFAGRLYNFKICENNILVRNFIPCYRKSDSVIGLYDTVNQQFYTNAGTGTFTKGSDIG